MKSKKLIGAIIAAVIILAGFGIVYYTEDLGNNVHKGNINITVADSSSGNITGIYATFSKVALESNGSSWQTHSLGNVTVNVLVNATYSQLLGRFPMQAQTYSGAKLYINSVKVAVNGVNTTYHLSKGYASTNTTFHVLSHESTILLFDFNANRDVNLTSQTFTPGTTVYTSL